MPLGKKSYFAPSPKGRVWIRHCAAGPMGLLGPMGTEPDRADRSGKGGSRRSFAWKTRVEPPSRFSSKSDSINLMLDPKLDYTTKTRRNALPEFIYACIRLDKTRET